MQHTRELLRTGAGGDSKAPGPVLMGILNVTPDSFSDGGLFVNRDEAVSHALQMLDEGATVIDVGGESTRPGSDPVLIDEEIERVVPVVREIVTERPEAVVSIDTYHARTAEAALEAGATVVNDISAGLGDGAMFPLVAQAGCPLVLMHMKGDPTTMQLDPHYEDVVLEVRQFLQRQAEAAIAAGVSPDDVILDPGIGFGKTLEHNLTLLRNLGSIASLGFPVMVGTSRKTFIGTLTGVSEAGERVYGTVATSVLAYERGARLFRVHDVRANREALEVAAAFDRA